MTTDHPPPLYPRLTLCIHGVFYMSNSMKTKPAQREGECSWCQEPIHVGEKLFPVLECVTTLARATTAQVATPIHNDTTNRTCLWIHTDCAEVVFATLERPVEPPACRHWLRLQQHCPFGDECFFLHPTTHISEHVWPDRRTWGGRRRKVFKPTSSVFRAWLLHTFGHEVLQSSGGVLEVAGGKGGYS